MAKAYTLGLYEKAMPKDLTWKEKMLAAKEAGFDFIEISIDETDEKLARLDWSKEERLELVNLMKETGVPIRTMCLSGHRKYPLGSNDPEICSRGMEIMETEFMNTVEKAMAYVKKVESTYLNVYPDLGNITNAAVSYGTDVLEDLETGRGHLVAMHLKETVPGKFREIPFGTGHVNFAAGIQKAWELGVRKFVTEFWYVGNPQWKDDLAFANHMMTELLNKQD